MQRLRFSYRLTNLHAFPREVRTGVTDHDLNNRFTAMCEEGYYFFRRLRQMEDECNLFTGAVYTVKMSTSSAPCLSYIRAFT